MVVVIHLRVLAAITPRQPEDLGAVVHTQTQQAPLEHQAKDRQAVLVRLVQIIPAAVVAVQRLPVALHQQIAVMAVMAAQGSIGNLLELIMRVEAGLVAVVLPEQVALAVVAMVDQMLLVLMELLILAVVAVGLETPLS